jgi:hypothetical protein
MTSHAFDYVSDDPYDDFVPDRTLEDYQREIREQMIKDLEIFKIASTIKQNIVKQAHQDCATYLLAILRAVTSEQYKLGLLDESEKNYILDSVFHAALTRGYIE